MALRGLTSLALFLLGSSAAVGCGGATDTDFTSDDASAGDSAGEGGNGGSSQGGSSQGGSSRGGSSQGGSSQGGTSGSSSGGSSQGGNEPTGGSSTGGTPSGGASGTDTGGATTGGSSGSGGTDGGTGGTAGTSSGGVPSGGTGGLPSDCARIISDAQAALLAAQACDPNAAAKCTGKVEDLCDCVVPVNDESSQQTANYLELREAAIKCGVACLAIVCLEPTAVTCGFGGATTRIVARAQCTYSPR